MDTASNNNSNSLPQFNGMAASFTSWRSDFIAWAVLQASMKVALLDALHDQNDHTTWYTKYVHTSDGTATTIDMDTLTPTYEARVQAAAPAGYEHAETAAERRQACRDDSFARKRAKS